METTQLGASQPVLGISYVALQPHLVITHPTFLGTCLILRIPEYVRGPSPDLKQNPGDVRWETVEPNRRLRFFWDAPGDEKARYGTDFRGEAISGPGEVAFSVSFHNLADRPHPGGPNLFCLQAGATFFMRDYEGEATYVRCGEGWRTVADMIQRQWQPHRMCGWTFGAAPAAAGFPTARLMVKESRNPIAALGIALDSCASLSCNHGIWPSCIHANPTWGEAPPDVEKTVHGKVYYVTGDKDDVLRRYQRDFEKR